MRTSEKKKQKKEKQEDERKKKKRWKKERIASLNNQMLTLIIKRFQDEARMKVENDVDDDVWKQKDRQIQKIMAIWKFEVQF